MMKSMSRPDSSAHRSAMQRAWNGVMTLAVESFAVREGVRPFARIRPRRPLRRSAGLRSILPACTASPRIVISRERAEVATERA